jgi:erythromycin esterase-like protein
MAHPLLDAKSLDPLLEKIGDAQIVMLGEASHGTHEYYTWRSRISKRLITEKDYRFIAVEGDWPDCMAINRAIRQSLSTLGERGRGEGLKGPLPLGRGRGGVPEDDFLLGKGSGDNGERTKDFEQVLSAFRRWPTWMWANWEIAALGEWMREHNADAKNQVGFYGLDVYSLFESMDAVLRHLEKDHPEAVADAARAAFACFAPYREDPVHYARATLYGPTECEDEVVGVLRDLLGSRTPGDDPEDHFEAEMNAWAAVDAERYYRTMVRGSSESWNVRDIHMMDTLDRLIDREGKAIVWAHNTHVGDARFTDMAAAGMTNLGQLARERYGEENVVLVGFGSYEGSVIAGEEWGAPMERMPVPRAQAGSWEAHLHEQSAEDRLLLDFTEEEHEVFVHRAIGVVYNPHHERYGNYVPTIVPHRYDAFLYLDKTQALHPLHTAFSGLSKQPDTYPFAV